MEFITNIKKDIYSEFVCNHNGHFLQSYGWGEFNKELGYKVHYIGVEDNNKLIGVSMLIEKKLLFGYSYFYAPRGYVIDFNNIKLLEFMTTNIKKYVKKNKGIYIKIDPDIILHEIDEEAKAIKDGNNNYKIVNILKSLGYKHLGYTKNFELNQPRYTFRINLEDNLDDIISRFSKTTIQRIKSAEKYNVKIEVGKDNYIHEFYKLMSMTENRKDFIMHEEPYYQKLYNMYSKEDNIKIFLASVNPTNILKDLIKDKEELNDKIKDIESIIKDKSSKALNGQLKDLGKQKESLENRIDKFSVYSRKYKEDVYISAYFIIYFKNRAWVLYAGNHNDLVECYGNYKVYFEHIKYAKEHNIKTYDLFGTIGDLRKDNPYIGIHEFKKKFGGEYIEFIGEVDLITNNIMYFIYKKLIPFYHKIIRISLRKKRSKTF